MFFGGLIAFLLLLMLLARFHPGSGADLLDWDPQHREAARVLAEREDLDQMLERENRRRRERGLPDLDEEELRISVARARGDSRSGDPLG